MKLLRASLAAGVLLAVSSGLRADSSTTSGQASWQWVSRYYVDPRPDELLPMVRALSRTDYFETVGQPAIAIGFFSTIFAQHPERVSYWLAHSASLPERHRRILAAAAWQAGHPRGTRMIQEMAATADAGLRTEIREMLAAGSAPVASVPVVSTASLNLQWGAFLASGDERHILNVLSALGSEERALASSARFALAQSAAAHPRVLEICRAQLSRQPEAIRAELRAALNAAAAKPGA